MEATLTNGAKRLHLKDADLFRPLGNFVRTPLEAALRGTVEKYLPPESPEPEDASEAWKELIEPENQSDDWEELLREDTEEERSS